MSCALPTNFSRNRRLNLLWRVADFITNGWPILAVSFGHAVLHEPRRARIGFFEVGWSMVPRAV